MTTNYPNPLTPEERKCEVSPQYGKDEMKQLHFYCENCGLEMDYREVRDCPSEKADWDEGRIDFKADVLAKLPPKT